MKHNNFTEAHTVVHVPEEVRLVPTYLRRQAQPKVMLGSAYNPPIRVSPAVEIHPKRPTGTLLVVATMIFFVMSMGVLAVSYM